MSRPSKSPRSSCIGTSVMTDGVHIGSNAEEMRDLMELMELLRVTGIVEHKEMYRVRGGTLRPSTRE